MSRLKLLDAVTWLDRPIRGDRSHVLLAALASARGRPVTDAALVETVWGRTDVPAEPAKALQVVVSRTRTQTAPDLVERVAGGYRLGAGVEVDASGLSTLVARARRALDAGEAATARDLAREALTVEVAASDGTGALAELRAVARADRDAAGRVLGRALSGLGEHAEALPLLSGAPGSDETTLVARLRSLAAVEGAPAALRAYERHRVELADGLGVDPGPALRALHAELLAADRPVRSGVLNDATPLVGRDDAIRRLRAAVAASRVVSIVGAGGLGKTRLAHLLGREAEQSVVHFVELAGVVSPDDVVGEVGSALGVRDSVSGRRVLTPEQRADVRTRIAQQLDQVPSLLILDNCEHVVDAVAELVGPLVASTRRLSVVTTTRAPLAIAAERVFALEQLDPDAAADLFRQRAEAARPGARLDDEEIRRVVDRLDGLPLAVELAAAKVRAMSVADIARRLDDRFSLLRGHDRAAPDRHQTLLAVIDWSWNLLGEPDRRALRRLAVLADGFALDAAEALVGVDALAVLESLAGQSLVTLREDEDGVRYRMLETVREFGRLQLGAAGEDDDTREALLGWALGRARLALADLDGPGQIATVRALRAEENNLADVLRGRIGAGDAASVVTLLAALATYWTIRGDHLRVISLQTALEGCLAHWEPPDDLVDDTVRAVSMLVMNTTIAELERPERCRELLATYGPRASRPRHRAMARMLGLLEGGRGVESLTEDPDRFIASLALQWASHARENDGDVLGAIEASTRAVELWRDDDGPWTRALQETQLAGLYFQLGRTEPAERYARAGLDALDALAADDDAVQLRAVLVSGAIVRGDLDEAERRLAEIPSRHSSKMWGGRVIVTATRGECALARGEVEEGLALLDEAAACARGMTFPGLVVEPGLEPWTLFAESTAVTAYARHGAGTVSDTAGRDLHASLRSKARAVVTPGRGRRDHPVIGCVLFALGAWALLRGGDVEPALDLLAVAEGSGYSRFSPSMAWPVIHAEAERVQPGGLDAAVARLGGRRGPDVLADAGAAVTRLLDRP